MARKSRKNQPQTELFESKAIIYVAIGYTRISKEGEKSDDSIENQAAIIRDYVIDKPDIDLKKVITTDSGYTGTNFDRPGYTELMNGIQGGTTECVIVKDLSRLGRDYIEVGELLFDTFPAYNVRFISVNDHYDSFADDASKKKLLILFKNLLNHVYSKDLEKKIRSAHAMKKQRGELAGQPPYGYMRGEDGKQLAIDEGAAEIVRMIFEKRLSGTSASGIAKYMNQSGIPTPQRRRYLLGQITHEKFSVNIIWSVEIICNILKNETYTGLLIQGKYDCNGKSHRLLPEDQWIRHENKHPAIIRREQFDAVQKLVNASSKRYRKTGNITLENVYVGKVFCSRCGNRVHRANGGSTNITYYYVCRRCADELKHELGLKRVPSLPLVKLDAVVAGTLRAQMDLLIQYDSFVAQAMQSDKLRQKRAALNNDKAKLAKEIVGVDRTIQAAYIHHLDGLLDFREYELIREKSLNEKETATRRLTYMENELRRLDINSVDNNSWREQFHAFRNFDAPTKELVQALVSRIILEPLTNIANIELNYMDSFAELKNLLAESGVTVNA